MISCHNCQHWVLDWHHGSNQTKLMSQINWVKLRCLGDLASLGKEFAKDALERSLGSCQSGRVISQSNHRCKGLVAQGAKVVSLSRSGAPNLAAPWVSQVSWQSGDVLSSNLDPIMNGAEAVSLLKFRSNWDPIDLVAQVSKFAMRVA